MTDHIKCEKVTERHAANLIQVTDNFMFLAIKLCNL